MKSILVKLLVLFAITAGCVGFVALLIWSKQRPAFRPPHMQASGWVIEKTSNRVRPDAEINIWCRRRFRTGPGSQDTASSTTLVKSIVPDSGFYRFDYEPGQYEVFTAKVRTADGKIGQMMLLPAVDSTESPFMANLPVE